MKTIKRRLLSLVLAMAMVLTLAPGARMRSPRISLFLYDRRSLTPKSSRRREFFSPP